MDNQACFRFISQLLTNFHRQLFLQKILAEHWSPITQTTYTIKMLCLYDNSTQDNAFNEYMKIKCKLSINVLMQTNKYNDDDYIEISIFTRSW